MIAVVSNEALARLYASERKLLIERRLEESLLRRILEYADLNNSNYKASARLATIRVLGKPSLKSVHELIRIDDLYESVTDSGINITYFALALASYIFKVGNLNPDSLYAIFDSWSSEKASDQAAYTQLIKLCIDRLAVFYD